MPKNAQTTAQLHSSHASKVMLKILQARLQQYVNCELPDVQAGFRKSRGTRSNCQHLLDAKECSNYRTIALISQASKVMVKILQARLQQYVNHELPDVQADFRKGRGTRDQIANIRWIVEKAREFQKSIYFCFIDYAKAFDCVERDGNTRPPDLPLEKSVCRSGSNS